MAANLARLLRLGLLPAAVALALVASPAPARADTEAGATARGDGDRPASLRTTEMCIDKEIADRLAVKRKRRGAVDRLYVKQNRHEFSASGGYFISDLYSATYIAGGSYTYHMTEQTAVEFGLHYTHQDADTIRAIEGGRGTVLEDDFARTLFADSVLVLSPLYGKFRLGGTIMHFDMHADIGVGVVDSSTSRGPAGVGGLGFKIFLGQPVALRIDLRDRVYRQELLDEAFIVNDIAVTAGLSLFLPLGN